MNLNWLKFMNINMLVFLCVCVYLYGNTMKQRRIVICKDKIEKNKEENLNLKSVFRKLFVVFVMRVANNNLQLSRIARLETNLFFYI